MINQKFGLADLTNSIFNSIGVPNTSDLLGLGIGGQRECLILIDGMGQDALDRFADQFTIFSQLKNQAKLIANFPSTTATSLSTLGTGELPGVHGMLGYTVRVPRSDNRLLNALKWDERVDPVMWQKVPTLFERAVKSGVSVSHVAAKRYEGSGFTQAALRGAKYIGANGLDEMDIRILKVIIDKFSGGPVGLTTIATAIGENAGTLEEVYEPFLIQEGFLMRTPRGRKATEKTYRHLGKDIGWTQGGLF